MKVATIKDYITVHLLDQEAIMKEIVIHPTFGELFYSRSLMERKRRAGRLQHKFLDEVNHKREIVIVYKLEIEITSNED